MGGDTPVVGDIFSHLGGHQFAAGLLGSLSDLDLSHPAETHHFAVPVRVERPFGIADTVEPAPHLEDDVRQAGRHGAGEALQIGVTADPEKQMLLPVEDKRPAIRLTDHHASVDALGDFGVGEACHQGMDALGEEGAPMDLEVVGVAVGAVEGGEEIGSESPFSRIDGEGTVEGSLRKRPRPLRRDRPVTHGRSADDAPRDERLGACRSESHREGGVYFVHLLDKIGMAEEALLVGVGFGGGKREVGIFSGGDFVDPVKFFKRVKEGFVSEILTHGVAQEVEEIA